jgi:predicted nicotinamide N-methyase
VLWEISPLLAEWLLSPDNVLFQQGALSGGSVVLELGSGIGGVVAMAMGTRVARFLATDQAYVLRGLERNLERNAALLMTPEQHRPGGRRGRRPRTAKPEMRSEHGIECLELDWETSSICSLPELLGEGAHLDAVLACDCIYNESLIEPFVRTCSELCSLSDRADRPTFCLIAQQIRSPDVLEEWLKAFSAKFKVWRLTDELLTEELRSGSGYVIHFAVLRE